MAQVQKNSWLPSKDFERQFQYWPLSTYAIVNPMLSEMSELLEHCLCTCTSANDGRMIAAAKAKFKAWTRRNDIEDVIIHIKEREQYCHSRFQVCVLNPLHYDGLIIMPILNPGPDLQFASDTSNRQD